jgi:hypothetical protein
MTLKDRFWDYWTTTEYEEYKYDLSIFECMIYCCVGSIALVIEILSVILTLPLWSIPYLVYKSHRLKMITR